MQIDKIPTFNSKEGFGTSNWFNWVNQIKTLPVNFHFTKKTQEKFLKFQLWLG
jgi:hypothetical protein